MYTQARFLIIGQRFQYKNTIFEKISLGKAKCVYVSSRFKANEEIILSHNTWVHYQRPIVPTVRMINRTQPQLQLIFNN